MITLYHFPLSGHAHRIELFLSLISADYEVTTVDLVAGEHKKKDFLKINPAGQVPAITDGDVAVSDSNAILIYLAQKYAGAEWYGTDPVKNAEIQRWLTAAAGELAYGPASARLVTVFGAGLDHENAKTVAYGLFDKMDKQLANQDFLTGDTATIADVALYSYTAHAPEGDVSLEPYANIRAWIERVQALKGFVAMPATKAGLAA